MNLFSIFSYFLFDFNRINYIQKIEGKEKVVSQAYFLQTLFIFRVIVEVFSYPKGAISIQLTVFPFTLNIGFALESFSFLLPYSLLKTLAAEEGDGDEDEYK